RRRHTRFSRDWSSDVCSSDLFIKSGFTKLHSDMVKPFRVAESPVQLECKVNDIISLGDQGGAGNLIICEVVKIHISKEILNENGGIDQHKIDLIARMGGNWYTRATPEIGRAH